MVVQFQAHNARESPDPTTLFRICRRGDLRTGYDESPCVITRGIGWRWEGRFPRLDAASSVKRDGGEKVFSCPGDPRSRNETASFQRVWVVMEEVDDVVEYLWGEMVTERHFGPWVESKKADLRFVPCRGVL